MIKKLTAALLAVIMIVGICQNGLEVLAAELSEYFAQQTSEDDYDESVIDEIVVIEDGDIDEKVVITEDGKKKIITSEPSAEASEARTVSRSSNKLLVSSDGNFEYYTDGTLYRYLGTDTEVIIPEEINGTTITTIDAHFISTHYTESIPTGHVTHYFNFKQITKLSIPSTVVKITNTSLWGFLNDFSPSIEEVIVDEDNTVYSSQDGVLYNKNKTSLILYPASKNDETFILPETVVSIGSFAFNYCKYIKTVIMNDSLNYIGKSAFAYSCIETLTVPDTVITISDYAFYSCKQLKTVIMNDSLNYIGNSSFAYSCIDTLTVPKNVTTIGSYAFCGCYNLKNFNISSENEKYEFYDGAIYLKGRETMVELLPYYATSTYTVPANVKTLGTGALSGCDKIQYLTIPNTVTTIDYGVCQDCDGLISVNFPSNITKIPDRMFYGCRFKYGYKIPEGITSLGYGAFSSTGLEEITIPSSVKTVGRSCFAYNYSLKTATIENGLESIGVYLFEGCSQLKTIMIKSYSVGLNSSIFYDIPSNTTFYGYYGSTTEEFAKNNNYTFIGIGSAIYATATSVSNVKTDRTTESADLDIELSDITSAETPSDIPFLDKEGFSLDLSLVNVEVAREIDNDDKTTKFSIGIGVKESAYKVDDNLTSEVNTKVFENHLSLKSFVDKLDKATTQEEIKKYIDSYAEKGYDFLSKENLNILGKSFSSEKGGKVDVSVFGYLDVVRGFDGSFKSTGGKLVVAISAKASVSHQLIIGVVPIVIKGELSASIKTNIGLRINFEHEDKPIIDFEGGLTLTLPGVKLSAGIGVGCLADVSVYGSLKNVLKYDYNTTSLNEKFSIKGEAGVSVKLLFFEKEWPIVSGELVYYDLDSKYGVNSVSAMIDDGEWEMSVGSSDRALNWNSDSSDLSGTSTLQNSVYENAKPKLVTTNDITMLVWTQSDTANRTVGNHTEVVYSIYDKNNGTWSAPKIVCDDGTADFYPAVATDGDEIYVTWVNANKKFDSASDIDEVAKSTEIYVAKYNSQNDCFENVNRLTNNNLFDTIPEIAVADGKAVVVWKANSNNSITEYTGTDGVYYAVGNSDGTYSVSKLCETANLVSAVATDGKSIAYLAQTDGDSYTTNDTELFAATIGGQVSQITSSNVEKSNLAVSNIGGSLFFTYTQNGELYATDDFVEIEKISADDVYIENYQFVSNGSKTSLLQEIQGDNSSEIYKYSLDSNGLWNTPMRVTVNSDDENSYYAKDFAAIMKSDGKILTSYVLTTAEIVEDSVVKNCSLCTQTLSDVYNLTLNSVTYDEENYSNKDSSKYTLSITNNGTCNISKFYLKITDESGNIISNDTRSQAIKSGETVEYTMYQSLGINGGTKYTFTVTPLETDYDLSDNSVEKHIGYSDLGVFVTAVDKGDDAGIYLKVINNNNIRTAADVVLRADDENGVILDKYNLGLINGLSESCYYIESNKLRPYLDAYKNIYITVESFESEFYLEDNSAPIYVGDMEYDEAESTLIGDADLDNEITVSDVTLIQKHIANIITLNENAQLLSDVDFSGTINIKDATIIQYYLASLGINVNVGKNYNDVKPTEPTVEPTTLPTTEPVTQPTMQDTNYRTIYYYNSNSWSLPYAYYWSDSNTNMTSWPGVAMTKLNDNYFSITVPKDTQYIIFSNNGNLQTADISLNSSYNCYSNGSWINYGEENETVSPTESITQPTTQDTNYRTIYYYNSSNWSLPYAYYWSDSNTNMTSWPGMTMTKLNDNYFSITVPKDTEYIIFSNNGSSQTSDIRLDTMFNCYYGGKWMKYHL